MDFMPNLDLFISQTIYFWCLNLTKQSEQKVRLDSLRFEPLLLHLPPNTDFCGLTLDAYYYVITLNCVLN